MALKKLCRCGKLIDYGQRYCSECEPKVQQEKTERHKFYDTYQRNQKAKKFYNSPEWLATRAHVLSKYKGLDLYAFFISMKIAPGTTVHHIVELEEDWSLRLAVSNLFPTSESNHNVIDGLYRRDKEGTQKMLRELLERWEREYGGK